MASAWWAPLVVVVARLGGDRPKARATKVYSVAADRHTLGAQAV
jgi:hypothetical protein